MTGLRVLLAPIGSRVLGDVVENLIESEESVKVVGACQERGQIEPMLRETQADVVLLGMGEDEVPSLYSDLLGRFPDLTVIGLAKDGQRALLAVDDVGADDLMATLVAAKGSSR
ncbi:MAG: hypothetical protein K0U98_20685 [Deltaproteobacteria bacterium]|nr:hypothetical protein [Deltaproteobacteria bacterium]